MERVSENFRGKYRDHGKQAIVANEGYSTSVLLDFESFSRWLFRPIRPAAFFSSPSLLLRQTRLCKPPPSKFDEESKTSNDLARGAFEIDGTWLACRPARFETSLDKPRGERTSAIIRDFAAPGISLREEKRERKKEKRRREREQEQREAPTRNGLTM